jgi:hypothetical protein
VLGSHNCTIKGFFRQLEELTGVRSPTIEPPYILLHAAATFLYVRVALPPNRLLSWQPRRASVTQALVVQSGAWGCPV